MSTFLYAPGVKVYVSTEKNGTLDVSDDLVDGTMVRRSDGVSSFNFTLQNTRRKYDGVFAPNDRIIVMMKRITWMRVFTGYLNSVPLLTAWPRVVPLTASCSLKRLQYWYWDAGLQASQTMVAQAIQAVKTTDDGGMANAILAILKNVVGWPEEKIHIAGIPQNWFKFAYQIAKDIDARAEEADELARQYYSLLQGQGVTAGVPNGGSSVSTGTMKPGNYGGEDITAVMCPYIEDIYNTGKQLNASNRDIIIGLMVAMQESSMGSDASAMQTPNRFGCVGLFQQTVGSWGTLTQLHDPLYQCKKFFTALLKVSNRDSMSLWQAGEVVQRSGVGQNTAKHENMARAVLNFLTNSTVKGSAPTSANDPRTQNNTQQWNTGKSTGLSFLTVCLNLVRDHPNIPYQLGGDSPPTASVPTKLDCSSFSQWGYYHTVGPNSMPRTAAGQQSWCRKVSASQALSTRGALVFVGDPAHHVEVSIGDGRHTVGAHRTGTYASVVSDSPSYWTNGGLLPNLDYSADGGGVGVAPSSSGTTAGSSTTSQIAISDNKSQPWYNPNDKFDSLFGNNPWIPQVNAQEAEYSAVFTGIRALLNDQPLLPYLKNLFNSTMRSFCSAPNGDLIGWFPDYYGLWGTAAAMVIEPIEIRDFNVTWSDDYFVTHQYTTAGVGGEGSVNQVDLASGATNPAYILNAAMTMGIASIDVPSIMYSLFGLEATKEDAQKFINFVYKRFGARPDFQQLPGVVGAKGEFFSALFLFQRQWAYQYNADIPITFMPELWPGMLIKVPAFDFQAYVTTVTHCQPAGTLIRISDALTREEGSSRWSKTSYRDVPIETLKEGDRVVSWIPRSSNFSKRGQVVNKITTRQHDGPLVVAKVGDATTKYAPNHHCVVKLGGPLDEGEYVVYLMRRNGQYRVGRCLWSYGNKAVGPIRRAINEQADAVWLLSVHQTAAEASLHEALTQVGFGLPRESFVDQDHFTMDLPTFWSKIGDNTIQASACLDRHSLLIDYPLWSADGIHLGRGEIWTVSAGARNRTVTAAANLRSGMMMLRVGGESGTLRFADTEDLRQAWIPIEVGSEWYTGLIYSLSVERDHTYIADGVMTHNSFSFGKNGGFSTSVNIAAPARLPNGKNDRSNVLIGLPVAGGLTPRTGSK